VPISLGRPPLKELPAMFKKSRDFDLKTGKGPFNPESITLKTTKLGKVSTPCGIVPTKLFPKKSMVARLVNCASPGGIVPEIPICGNAILVTE
jgi:hypothetical protein